MPSASPILLRPTPPPPSGPLFSQNHYLRTSLPRLSPSPLNLLTPVECALPRFASSQFVTSIESTRPRKKNHHFADLPAVTPVSTTLTDTAPRNPIRMNTSTKPTRVPSPCSRITTIYSLTYAVSLDSPTRSVRAFCPGNVISIKLPGTVPRILTRGWTKRFDRE